MLGILNKTDISPYPRGTDIIRKRKIILEVSASCIVSQMVVGEKAKNKAGKELGSVPAD